ncbi:hypothetical protein KOW79_011882 [Hemibagrus wyckioides]|uniref:Uncharacterized protein n=1 Tax=Hemibagrus wyckioides TaxID=337641 RepID=A0A9D3SIE0_9TELE|nr:hypothetical protein KOW79_011882 [Hemibagrus wyckioides]
MKPRFIIFQGILSTPHDDGDAAIAGVCAHLDEDASRSLNRDSRPTITSRQLSDSPLLLTDGSGAERSGNGRPKHNPAVRTEAREEDKEESGVQSVGWRILPPEESRGLGSRAGSSLLFSQVKATSSYSQIPPYSRQSASQLLDRAP